MIDEIIAGNRLALSRGLTAVENNTTAGRQILSGLYSRGGKAHLVGITGSPGTGKSSLVNQLALKLRQDHPENKIAIIAVDPSSPFTGGAVLGDRVRMRDLSGDDGIFIRSMASRGALGGLARTTSALAQLFDCAGYETIFIETVGAGQNEVDIVRLAHSTIVVEAPGLGDDIQAIKAGILEIADILVVNKADRQGVEATERALKMMLELANGNHSQMGHHRYSDEEPIAEEFSNEGWQTPVLRTVATEKIGIEELTEKLLAHKEWLQSSGEWKMRERERVRAELLNLLHEGLFNRWLEIAGKDAFKAQLEKVLAREISPQSAIDLLVDR